MLMYLAGELGRRLKHRILVERETVLAIEMLLPKILACPSSKIAFRKVEYSSGLLSGTKSPVTVHTN